MNFVVLETTRARPGNAHRVLASHIYEALVLTSFNCARMVGVSAKSLGHVAVSSACIVAVTPFVSFCARLRAHANLHR